ncbi:uncharacterized protein PG986_008448 [Apiospora aurea]|uniref:Uncharacterized protein n=1 Tax=Apiospora aurea TaxID=335848 RepID=A0ABR1QFF1_9PEZI
MQMPRKLLPNQVLSKINTWLLGHKTTSMDISIQIPTIEGCNTKRQFGSLSIFHFRIPYPAQPRLTNLVSSWPQLLQAPTLTDEHTAEHTDNALTASSRGGYRHYLSAATPPKHWGASATPRPKPPPPAHLFTNTIHSGHNPRQVGVRRGSAAPATAPATRSPWSAALSVPAPGRHGSSFSSDIAAASDGWLACFAEPYTLSPRISPTTAPSELITAAAAPAVGCALLRPELG